MIIQVRQGELVIVFGKMMKEVEYISTMGMNPCVGLVLWNKDICALAHIDNPSYCLHCIPVIEKFVSYAVTGYKKAEIIRSRCSLNGRDDVAKSLKELRKDLEESKNKPRELAQENRKEEEEDKDLSNLKKQIERRERSKIMIDANSKSSGTQLDYILHRYQVAHDLKKPEGLQRGEAANVRLNVKNGRIDYNFKYEKDNIKSLRIRDGAGKLLSVGVCTSKNIIEYALECEHAINLSKYEGGKYIDKDTGTGNSDYCTKITQFLNEKIK